MLYPLVNLTRPLLCELLFRRGNVFERRNFQIYQSNSPHHPRYMYYAIFHFGLRHAFKLLRKPNNKRIILDRMLRKAVVVQE